MKEFKEISDKNPFKVPENYFEEVNRKIISSTSGYGMQNNEKSLYRKLRPFLAIAAAIAVLFVLSYLATYVFPGKNNSTTPVITLNEFSDNFLNDLDILTLEENAGYVEPNVAQIGVNSNDIIDYLVLENIEISNLYEQL